ncbi:MAG: hypothetical protein ACRDX8_11705, partial [Acidimicrobiales bacterium]
MNRPGALTAGESEALVATECMSVRVVVGAPPRGFRIGEVVQVLYRSTHNAVIPTSSPLAWCIEQPAKDGRSVWLDQRVRGALVGA